MRWLALNRYFRAALLETLLATVFVCLLIGRCPAECLSDCGAGDIIEHDERRCCPALRSPLWAGGRQGRASSASVACAKFSLQSLTESELKAVCVDALRSVGLVVTLRLATRDKRNERYRERYRTDPEFRAKMLARPRDRTKEIARRSEKRAIARALKAQIRAEETSGICIVARG